MPATAFATGPKTEAGKAASSRNAIRHGLTAQHVVLSSEDPNKFEDLRQSLIVAHQPAEGIESILIDQIAECAWRLNRARRRETEALEQELDNPGEETSHRLATITRYMAAIEREFHRCVRELISLQSIRTRDTAARIKAKSQEQLLQLQQQIREELFRDVPDVPPLTEQDVVEILSRKSVVENYETNPSFETGLAESADPHFRVLPSLSIIQDYETNEVAY